jgi:[acyl-carrier-protein] S-malonyltransferase
METSKGKLAILFPGQGSQSVGMGKDLFDTFAPARKTFLEIDKIAGRSLSQLCFEGPESELKRTINTQPTILAASLAALACYEDLGGPRPDFVAGHSLGEFTALVAAGSLDRNDAVKLVEKRAKLMEDCPAGAMAAVLGVEPSDLENSVQEVRKALLQSGKSETESVLMVANYNTREQLVISGNPDAVSNAAEKIKSNGGKVIPLPVGGAFHSPLMDAAAAEFRKELDKFHFNEASFEVVQNYDAKSSKLATELKSKLAKQMNSPVRWYESIEYMIVNGVTRFVEIGPGKALTGMVKRIDKSIQVFNVSDPSSLKTTVEALRHCVTTGP